MAYGTCLSPEQFEILRRLALRAGPKGFVTSDDINRAYGPRTLPTGAIEDILSYLADRGLHTAGDDDDDRSAGAVWR